MRVSVFKDLRSANVAHEVSALTLLKHLASKEDPKKGIMNTDAGSDLKSLKEQKKNCLCFTPHATFHKRRGIKNLKDVSGILFIDIDMTDECKQSNSQEERVALVNSLFDYVMRDGIDNKMKKHIFFCNVSASYSGIHIFFRLSPERIENIINNYEDVGGRFKAYYALLVKTVNKQIEEYQQDFRVDEVCNDLVRLCFLNYSMKSYYNSKYTSLNFNPGDTQRKKTLKGNSGHAEAAKETVIVKKTPLKELVYNKAKVSNLLQYICYLERETKPIEQPNGSYLMQCPFPSHNDHTPSFFVSLGDPDMYICFGKCFYPRGGQFYDFYAHYFGFATYEEVKKDILKKYEQQ